MSTYIPEDKHRQVLDTSVDVPEEMPSFPLPIGRVGISNKTVWVRLAANRGGHLPFTAGVFIDLDGSRRGIHMSRIEEAVSVLYDEEFTSLAHYGKELGSRVMAGQKTDHVAVELSGRLPVIRQAPVSRLSSVDSYEVSFTAVWRKDGRDEAVLDTRTGAGMYHLTACPCTQAYSEALFNRVNDPWPHATHSQRSKTTLVVMPPPESQLVAHDELIVVLENVLHLSRDLLKRPDETELVLKAHREPQFAEDIVRETARAVGKKFAGIMAPETRIRIHSHSLESIHIHDVECLLDTTLADILTTLQTTEQE